MVFDAFRKVQKQALAAKANSSAKSQKSGQTTSSKPVNEPDIVDLGPIPSSSSNPTSSKLPSLNLTASKLDEEEAGKLLPNELNGCTFEGYKWGQSLQDIDVSFSLIKILRFSSLLFLFLRTFLTVSLLNNYLLTFSKM